METIAVVLGLDVDVGVGGQGVPQDVAHRQEDPRRPCVPRDFDAWSVNESTMHLTTMPMILS